LQKIFFLLDLLPLNDGEVAEWL